MKRNTVLHSALFLLLAAGCGGATISVGSNDSKNGLEEDAVPTPPGPPAPTSTSTSQAVTPKPPVTPPPEVNPEPPIQPKPNPACGVNGLATLPTTNAPSARANALGDWAANRFVVWGGVSATGATLTDGGMFDPCTSTWTALSTLNAPSVNRTTAAHFVVGNKIIYWGGADAPFYPVPVTVSSVLDVAKNEWTPINRMNEPSFFAMQTLGIIDGKLIAWAGDADSGVFDPATNTWTKLSTVDAPEFRYAPAHAITGSKLVIWGGTHRTYANGAYHHAPVLKGNVWDATTDTWTSLPTLNAPTTASALMAANGTKIIVVEEGAPFGQLAKTWLFDFATNAWTAGAGVPMSGVNGIGDIALTWTGAKASLTFTKQTGSSSYLFDLGTLSWSPAAKSPVNHAQVWGQPFGPQVVFRAHAANSEVSQYSPYSQDYFLYDGSADKWTTVPSTSKRTDSAWAWSGDRLFIFGGGPPASGPYTAAQNDGYVFVP